MTTLTTTSVLHIINDAYIAILYPLLPLIAADLQLSYGQIGLLKAAFSGGGQPVPTADGAAGGAPDGRSGAGAARRRQRLDGRWAGRDGLGANVPGPARRGRCRGASAVARSTPWRPDWSHGPTNGADAARPSARSTSPGTSGSSPDRRLAGILGVTYGWRAALGALAAVGMVCSLVTLAGRTQVTRSVARLPARRAEQPRRRGVTRGLGDRAAAVVCTARGRRYGRRGGPGRRVGAAALHPHDGARARRSCNQWPLSR